MDVKPILLVSAVILASGCVSTTGKLPWPDSGEEESPTSTGLSGKGLEITKISVSDDSLTPKQETYLRLGFRNHLPYEIPIDQITPYNLGELRAANGKFKNPSKACTGLESGKIPRARRGLEPKVTCRWKIQAPPGSELGNFESISFNPRVRIVYSSKISNGNSPFQIEFREGTEIQSSGSFSHKYSNGEVKMTVKGSEPVPVGSQSSIEITMDSTDKGNVVSEFYTLSLTPSGVFQKPNGKKCSGDVKSISGSTIKMRTPIEDFSQVKCTVSSGKSVERNIILSASYKYQQSPTVPVEVVS